MFLFVPIPIQIVLSLRLQSSTVRSFHFFPPSLHPSTHSLLKPSLPFLVFSFNIINMIFLYLTSSILLLPILHIMTLPTLHSLILLTLLKPSLPFLDFSINIINMIFLHLTSSILILPILHIMILPTLPRPALLSLILMFLNP